MDADLDSGLFGIQLSDSEASGDDTTTEKAPARDAQSEEAFLEVKKTYRVKVEDGEVWKKVKLPLGPQVTKPEAQALLNAVEELYLFGRFAEGARFVQTVLHGEDGKSGLDDDTRSTLRYYETKCAEKAGRNP
ncbi:Uu.00g096570.m01.CDS01 [Anthostomella pinea]|uniref:Uu.00g096570.m01.CDS01 n=1 Tax=Anthostomella pinea TaxID=933095 RepID=A0AAI8YF33_9PEZI|nr:Uu.00g096570.m01.CDS01 [Anthostomella pinea]